MKSKVTMGSTTRMARTRCALPVLAFAAVGLSAWFSGCSGELEMTALAEFDSTVIRRAPGTYKIVTPLPSGDQIFYTLYVPNTLPATGVSVPLVVAAHFGGQVTTWYGGAFADLLIIPAFTGSGAVIVAPDAGSIGGWSDADEAGVMWLARELARVYPIDRRKVLMTGYSAGGGHTWLVANHNQDFFTAAIPVSARPRQNEVPWRIPVYVIHSQNDDLIPFETVQSYVTAQQAIGAPMRLTALTGMTHYQTQEFIPALAESLTWLREVWPP